MMSEIILDLLRGVKYIAVSEFKNLRGITCTVSPTTTENDGQHAQSATVEATGTIKTLALAVGDALN